MKIVILGAGNLATHLAPALRDTGEQIVQIYSRTTKSAATLAEVVGVPYTSSLSEINPEADLYIYAVSDSAIDELVSLNLAPDALHVHTAGSVPMTVFQGKKQHFGVFYPLQTFSRNKAVDFRQIPLFIEASSAADEEILKDLAAKLSEKVFVVDSADRLQLHLAAVFACNFVNHLYAVSEEIVARSGLPFDVLKPLILETADKIRLLSPAEAQTGPAKRNDRNVIDKHLSALTDKPELQQLYELLSKMIFDKNLHQP